MQSLSRCLGHATQGQKDGNQLGSVICYFHTNIIHGLLCNADFGDTDGSWPFQIKVLEMR